MTTNFFSFPNYPFSNLAEIETIAVLNRIPLIVVGNTGSGKSEIANYLKQNFEDVLIINTMSMTGLKPYAEELSNSNKIIFIDDIGAIPTQYMRITTITTLTYLTYQHFIKLSQYNVKYEIKNFNGTVIFNVQPEIYNEIVKETAFEANVKDKTLRFYYFNSFKTVEFEHPKIQKLKQLYRTINNKSVEVDKNRAKAIANSLLSQISQHRRIAILKQIVKTYAILKGHEVATSDDYNDASKLLLNMYLENFLLQRQGINLQYSFDIILYQYILLRKNLGSIITEKDIAKIMNVSEKTINRKLQNHPYLGVDYGKVFLKDSVLERLIEFVS